MSCLTCKTQSWKDFFLNIFVLVLSSACNLSAEVLVLYVCKRSVFIMSGEGELWDIAAWLAAFCAQEGEGGRNRNVLFAFQHEFLVSGFFMLLII